MRIKLVKDDITLRLSRYLHNDADAVFVRFVSQVCDPGYLFIPNRPAIFSMSFALFTCKEVP